MGGGGTGGGGGTSLRFASGILGPSKSTAELRIGGGGATRGGAVVPQEDSLSAAFDRARALAASRARSCWAADWLEPMDDAPPSKSRPPGAPLAAGVCVVVVAPDDATSGAAATEEAADFEAEDAAANDADLSTSDLFSSSDIDIEITGAAGLTTLLVGLLVGEKLLECAGAVLFWSKPPVRGATIANGRRATEVLHSDQPLVDRKRWTR